MVFIHSQLCVTLAMNLGGKVAFAVKLPGITTRENLQRESSTGRPIASSRCLECVCAEVGLWSNAWPMA